MTWKNNIEIEELKQYIKVLLNEQYENKNSKHDIRILSRIDALMDIYVYIKHKQRQETKQTTASDVWKSQEPKEWLK